VDVVTAATEYIDRLELMGMNFGLERMSDLMERLGHPEREFDAIHVVGSNGKSSTVRYIEALLDSEGCLTGAYLSPHLTTFRERIRIGGEPIHASAYDAAVLAVRDVALEVTQFEALTAAAFVAFAEAGVDWAVVEAGLGGRLDATNVLGRSRVQVLTNISLEHAQLLGHSREAIAREKLAVVPAGGRVIMGEAGWEALVSHAASTQVVTCGGSYQEQNRAVARAAAETALGRQVDRAPIAHLGIPGRFELRGRRPLEIWDGAHNPAGMQRLVAELPALLGDRTAVAVLSALSDKDVASMISLLRTVCPTIIATASSHDQALSPDAVASLAGGPVAEDPHEALEAAKVLAGPTGAVVVCGSLYLLRDLEGLSDG
jgi:dihydrofolate synthase / folylpolyglutamate synthase